MMLQVICIFPVCFVILFTTKNAFEVPNARKVRLDSFHNPNKNVYDNYTEFKSILYSI